LVQAVILLRLGFRPFYLLAATFAIVAMLLWLFSFTGQLQFGEYLQGVLWHGHEMVFGYIAAVFTGFLFTAVRNWTGMPTPTGPLLGGIVLLWLVARILLLTGPTVPAILLDVIFLPAVTIAVAIPVLRSRNQRNYKVLAILAALSVMHFAFHLALAGNLPAWLSRSSLLSGIDIIAILFALIGGRVIPAFTQNAVPGSDPVHNQWVETWAFGLLILIALMSLFSGALTLTTWLPPLLLFLAAAVHTIRLALWQPQLTLNNPLLWMMPLAYSWLPFTLLLRALSELAIVVPGVWIHALTAGALSSLMIAMMMRSSLGHTGRQLAASRADMAAFLLLQLAAILRILAGVSGSYQAMIVASGAAWILAFAIFLSRYLPMLVRPRIDGRPG
jgi:uncharacterized protein involved in response to NO